MFWFLLCAIVGSTIVFTWIAWRKWIAPWRQIEKLVRQIGDGERPRTFLVDGGREARRVGVALENVFTRQQEINRQLGERASGDKAIFSAMRDGLLVVDRDCRITLLNRTFQELFDLRDNWSGAPLLETLRDPAIERAISETLQTGEPVRREIAISDRQMQMSAVPMKNEVDGTNGALILFHDVSELKRMDQMRSDFVANVSHELRTPLSILRGYIETLLDVPKISRKESSRILEVMERHSERLGLLVEDLLSLAQLESGNSKLQVRDVDSAKLFADVLRDWEKEFATRQLKLNVDLTEPAPRIRADEARLRGVLDNLLDNAVKYSREKDEIHLKGERRGDEIALSVRDSGIGIAKEDLPRIFERFYRVDKARDRELGGTGLGLAIVKHIAQLHGGRVEAESELGKGTTIRVFLPIERSDAAAAVTQT
jgi:two-component system phosphate regulon sensor histidine kinase PhoR